MSNPNKQQLCLDHQVFFHIDISFIKFYFLDMTEEEKNKRELSSDSIENVAKKQNVKLSDSLFNDSCKKNL